MLKNDDSFTRKGQLTGIQYLRSIAALPLILDHWPTMPKLHRYWGLHLNLFSDFFKAGAVGVDLSFFISGFIIAFVWLSNQTLVPKISGREFFERRFARIMTFVDMYNRIRPRKIFRPQYISDAGLYHAFDAFSSCSQLFVLLFNVKNRFNKY